MDVDDRNAEFIECNNVIGIMTQAMHDLLIVEDEHITDHLLTRYRIAISIMERARKRMAERKDKVGIT